MNNNDFDRISYLNCPPQAAKHTKKEFDSNDNDDNLSPGSASYRYAVKRILRSMEEEDLSREQEHHDNCEVSFLEEPNEEFVQYKNRNKKSFQDRKYYIYYTTNQSVREVSKATFSSAKGKIKSMDYGVLKIVGLSEKHVWKNHADKVKKFEPQTLKSCLAGVYASIRGLQAVGNTALGSASCLKSLKDMLFNVISTLVNCTRLINEFSFMNLLSTLLDFYRCINTTYTFAAQSADALLLSAASLFMPTRIFEFFKRITVFTNIKFLDDPSNFYDLIVTVLDFIDASLEKVPFGKGFIDGLRDGLNGLRNYVTYFKFMKLVKMCDDLTRSPRIATNHVFRQSFNDLKKQIDNDHAFTEWTKRSNTLVEGKAKIVRSTKILAAYESGMRLEPSCFVFEGPPGCNKSVLLNGVISASKESVYFHSVKSMMDGKDWYDAYNNETIFAMDDVGQQGVSQWRTIINMVSPVKLPLDCAEASLKDTKFFTSEKILVTTNNFSELQGLTKADCITEITALWRRASVFKFCVNRRGEKLEGEIQFKTFQFKKPEGFVNEFPEDVSNYLKTQKIDLAPTFKVTYDMPDAHARIIAWMLDIIEVTTDVKHEQKTHNEHATNTVLVNSFRKVGNGAFVDAKDTINTKFSVKPVKKDDAPMTSKEANKKFAPQVMGDDIKDGILLSTISAIYDSAVDSLTSSDSDEDYSDDENVPRFKPFWSASDFGNGFKQKFPKGRFENIPDMNEDYPYVPEPITPRQRFLSFFKVFGEVILTTGRDLITSLWGVLTTMDLITSIAVSIVIIFIIYSIVALVNGQKREVSVKPLAWQSQGGGLHPSVAFVAKNVYPIVIHNNGVDYTGVGLVSGHHIITVGHGILSKAVYISIFKDQLRTSPLFDHCKYELVYLDAQSDTAVLRSVLNMATPFKNISKHIHGMREKINTDLYFVGDMIFPMHSIATNEKYSDVYQFKNAEGKVVQNSFGEKDFFYKYQRQGLCGSAIFDVANGILGIHVAGDGYTNTGIAIAWSDEVKNTLHDILEKDTSFILDVEISKKVEEGFSGIKLDQKMHLSTPKATKMIPSPIYGVFPVTREPPDFQKYGPHTVKDVGKKSFKRIKNVVYEEVAFAKKIISSIVDDFYDLTEEEVVGGNEYLAPLNKDSSNGYGCLKAKEEYINFAEKKFTPKFKEELDTLIAGIENGKIGIEDLMWTESLKDEIRDVEKAGVPRSFRVSRIHMQVLTKMCFGDMVQNLIKTRKFHGISVGINPFKEWETMHELLLKCVRRFFSNDLKVFDGGMLAQVQTEVDIVLMEKYKGRYPKVVALLLAALVYCLVAMNDDLYMTNHSMPSGSFLTAIFNSLVNKFYKGMWYYRYAIDKTVHGFFHNVLDFVYGDDTLNGIYSETEVDLNAITMKEFFDSIGIECTTAQKGPVVKKYDELKDITFLKRSFVFHRGLGKIVCPLDLSTIYSTLSWCSEDKDVNDVLQDKIHSFQREIYLHEDLYEEGIKVLEEKCKEANIMFKKLPISYIKQLYLNEPEIWKLASYSNSKYM